MENTLEGSCLCKTVRYAIEGPFSIFQYCFCSRCRKFTGSAHSANLFIPPERFQWLQGLDSIGRYEHPEAKYFATTFCKNCGSSLPWLVKGGKNVVVTAGSLDDEPPIKPVHTVFWGSRAAWYEDPCKLDTFETLPGK